MLVKQSIRETCDLLTDITLPVFYLARKYKSSGRLRVLWEASVQDIAITQKLLSTRDPHLHPVRNIQVKMKECRVHLGSVNEHNSRIITTELRLVEFSK